MNVHEIKELISSVFGEGCITGEQLNYMQPQLTIATDKIALVCDALLKNERTYFDFLSCLTAIDNGPVNNTFEVIYNLYSLPYAHEITLKINVKRTKEGIQDYLPVVPSVSIVYKTALWHEREAYDLFGIVFENHPDMRRIFLPEDWKGYPLRKDYNQEAYYRGIKVDY